MLKLHRNCIQRLQRCSRTTHLTEARCLYHYLTFAPDPRVPYIYDHQVFPIRSNSVKYGNARGHPAEVDVGAEITGTPKSDWPMPKLIKCLNAFSKRTQVRELAVENGIESTAFNSAYLKFRDYVLQSTILPADLHITMNDLIQDQGHVDDLYPFFLNYARETNPLLENKEDIDKLSDFTNPASWYPEARKLKRKIIYHVGPTNSGKTYHALQRFLNCKTGVYCGPLRLLAQEVFQKANQQVRFNLLTDLIDCYCLHYLYVS